jgi:hypothetical protein
MEGDTSDCGDQTVDRFRTGVYRSRETACLDVFDRKDGHSLGRSEGSHRFELLQIGISFCVYDPKNYVPACSFSRLIHYGFQQFIEWRTRARPSPFHCGLKPRQRDRSHELISLNSRADGLFF